MLNMANYTTNVSDKTKSQVMRSWLIGLLGTLGFHFFKVGKIKHGLIRLIYGIFMWSVSIMMIGDAEIATFGKVFMFILLFIPSIFDLVRIQLGIFKDNVGNVIREK